MINPVSHSNPVSQAAAGPNPHPVAQKASNTQTKAQPVQDKVTLSNQKGDVDHDGDSK